MPGTLPRLLCNKLTVTGGLCPGDALEQGQAQVVAVASFVQPTLARLQTRLPTRITISLLS